MSEPDSRLNCRRTKLSSLAFSLKDASVLHSNHRAHCRQLGGTAFLYLLNKYLFDFLVFSKVMSYCLIILIEIRIEITAL